MVFIDKNKFNSLDDRQRISLINSLTGVKSANLVGTQSTDKMTNLSIISSVFHLGASPALFGFVIRPDSVPRDTLNNLRENPYLTVNHVNTNIIENAHQTSARYKAEESEFDKCKLTEEYIKDHPAPFVKESKIKFAAKMIREINIEENGTHIIICELTVIHLPEEYLGKDFSIDITKANSVGVSGLDQYLKLESLGRASYAKQDKIVKWFT
ncbi:MAG: flavin reductase (DIM6/NTAB) family NADH-FMN oxidoreductase RutF [Thermoproteota archaeon]|jgi:flavin reductase (DIM6/NTAB) family NADH-FMN oxidoreductase RutF